MVTLILLSANFKFLSTLLRRLVARCMSSSLEYSGYGASPFDSREVSLGTSVVGPRGAFVSTRLHTDTLLDLCAYTSHAYVSENRYVFQSVWFSNTQWRNHETITELNWSAWPFFSRWYWVVVVSFTTERIAHGHENLGRKLGSFVEIFLTKYQCWPLGAEQRCKWRLSR